MPLLLKVCDVSWWCGQGDHGKNCISIAKTVEMSKIQKAWLSKMVGSTPCTLLNSLYMVLYGHSSDAGNKSNIDIYEKFCLLEKRHIYYISVVGESGK